MTIRRSRTHKRTLPAGLATAIVAIATGVAAVIAMMSCVGDDPGGSSTSSQIDSSTSTTVDSNGAVDGTSPSNDGAVSSDAQGGDGGTPGCKVCETQCVPIDNPAYGCTTTGCTPCIAHPHIKSQKCDTGACKVDVCDDGYEDLNGDPADGCETPNAKSVTAVPSLALWLRADKGLTLNADGGVTSWANQASVTAPAAVVASGKPVVDDLSWPGKQTRTVKIPRGAYFSVDLSAMMSLTGFTLFTVEARLGTATNCIVGSDTYPMGEACCSASSKAMQLCYNANNSAELYVDVFCTLFVVSTLANTSAAYQMNLTNMWFTPTPARYYASVNNTFDYNNSGAQCPNAGPLTNLTAPGKLGGGYSAGGAYEGLMAEVVLYSTALSPADRSLVQSYLKKKWNTP